MIWYSVERINKRKLSEARPRSQISLTVYFIRSYIFISVCKRGPYVLPGTGARRALSNLIFMEEAASSLLHVFLYFISHANGIQLPFLLIKTRQRNNGVPGTWPKLPEDLDTHLPISFPIIYRENNCLADLFNPGFIKLVRYFFFIGRRICSKISLYS